MQIDRFKSVMLLLLFGSNLALAKLTPEQVKALPPPEARTVVFAKDIKPIFEASCTKCHARGKAKGGFRLDTRETLLKGGDSGPAIQPGKSVESYLIELVSGLDPDNVMPQKGSRLTAAQVGLLRAWVDQGAAWEAGVTFAKPPPRNLTPRKPELPPFQNGLTHPVDRLLQPYFARKQFTPPPPVDDRVFARRAYLDVIGLLPPPTDFQAFLSDARPDKREQLVDTLLADRRRYAEHWLTFWNDALRNDYRGTGYIDGGRKQISDWLYGALARNLPYDQFVAQLVNPPPEAEGFVRGIVWRGVVNASQTPQLQAAQNIAQVFLGVNLKCASCHDSFINDWTLADAYGLASVYADAPLEMFHCDKPTGKIAAPRFLYPELGDIPADAPKTQRQKRLATIMTCRANGRLTRTIVNRLWAKFMGRGLVEPQDDMEQVAWHPDLLDWLAEDLSANNYDLKHTLRLILTSRAYQMPAVNVLEKAPTDFVFTGPAVRRLSAEQFRDALGALTGVWHESPAVPLNLPATADGSGDQNLMPRSAQWIWSSREAAQKAPPQSVFFRKVFTLTMVPEETLAVATCDNSFTLYVNGQKVASGNNFQQPNFANLRPHLKVGNNVLAVAALNHRPNNQPPSANPPITDAEMSPAGFFLYARLRQAGQVMDVVSDSTWSCSPQEKDGWQLPGFDATDWTASAELGGADAAPWKLAPKLLQTLSLALVHGQVRASLVAADSLALALGRPNREQVITSRTSFATTLQALELTNGETLSRILAQGAEKLLAARLPTSSALVNHLYRQALGRSPTARETQLGVELLGEPAKAETVEDLLWAMTMLPEFQLIY